MEFKIKDGRLDKAFNTYSEILEDYVSMNKEFKYIIEMDEDKSVIRIELFRNDTVKGK